MSLFDMLSALLGAMVGIPGKIVDAVTYVPFVIIVNIVHLLDFDPFLKFIDLYNPCNVIGDIWTSSVAFLGHWVPIAEILTIYSLFFTVIGVCLVCRLLYNWLKLGSSSN